MDTQIYFSFCVPLTLFLGSDLLPLVKDKKNAPLLKEINELSEIFGFDKIKVIDDKENLGSLEYAFVSYGKVLLKETVILEEASSKILQSLENILISDDENILQWEKEIEEREKNERKEQLKKYAILMKPFFATIDGVKKGPFSARELSDIFQKGGFDSILLDTREKAQGTGSYK
jgi:hypothetical protein